VDWRSRNEASGVPSLSASQVENVAIRLPEIEEQRHIRRALDDADAEIGLLQERLKKAKAIKQGMMQELLTGHTRLPVQEAAA
jgi:type I restriction enzyme, S subunit